MSIKLVDAKYVNGMDACGCGALPKVHTYEADKQTISAWPQGAKYLTAHPDTTDPIKVYEVMCPVCGNNTELAFDVAAAKKLWAKESKK